jgi:hypothetical protein
MRRPGGEEGDTDETDGTARAERPRADAESPTPVAERSGEPDGADGDPGSAEEPSGIGDDPTETAAYRWLRVVKLLLGLVVSLLTALELLGLVP